MPMRRALRIILAISAFGLLFSGVLTYHELFGASAQGCPVVGAPGTVLGYPACVYGFFLYLAVTVVAAAGLLAPARSSPSGPAPATLPGTPPRP